MANLVDKRYEHGVGISCEYCAKFDGCQVKSLSTTYAFVCNNFEVLGGFKTEPEFADETCFYCYGQGFQPGGNVFDICMRCLGTGKHLKDIKIKKKAPDWPVWGTWLYQ